MSDPTEESEGLVRPKKAVAEQWEEKYSRGRGIYTDTDRRFLWDITEYDDAPSRSRRRRYIQNRTTNALRDLFYLPMIDRDLWDDIIEEAGEGAQLEGDFKAKFSRLVEFLWRSGEIDEAWLSSAIEFGLERAEYQEDNADRFGGHTANVDIELQRGHDLDELEEQLERDDRQLSTNEIGALVRGGRISPDDIEKLTTRKDSPYVDPGLRAPREPDSNY